MAVPTQAPPPPSYAEQTLRRMEAEHKLLADERVTGWGVIWTLFGFKIATVALILYMSRNTSTAGSPELMTYIAATTWYWFFIPLIAVSGFVAWRLRLRKARKQVESLKHSEFTVSADPESLTEDEKKRLQRVQRLAEHER